LTPPEETSALLGQIKWNDRGIVPAIVQDDLSGDVLMMAWMDRDAVGKTIESGQTHFYSRSRRKAWHKGETSGHVQHVAAILVDCDADVLLIRVNQVGGACHKGYRSCFFRRLESDGRLDPIADRVFSPEEVYKGSP
jgi:phosphoribosyl-AMP cyclohydrolase